MSTTTGTRTDTPDNPPGTNAGQPVVVDPPARRGTAAIVGLGVALLGAAAAVSTTYTRQDGDIDWSNYAIGLGATVALLLVVLAGSAGHDLAAKRALTGFPGAVGALAAGAMVAVGFDDESWVQWAVGGAILAISVLAYLLGRAGAPTVSAVVGLAVLYDKAVEELLDVEGDNRLITQGAVVVVFVVAVTALGWVLPHRALVGTFVGAGGVLGIAGLLATASIAQALGSMISIGSTGEPTSRPTNDLENDVYVFLAYSAALILLWSLAAWATGSSGFRVLAVVHSAVIVPLAMYALATEHPTWWGVGLAAAGAVLLLLALAAVRRSRPAPPPSVTEPPRPFFDSPPPPPPTPTPHAAAPESGTSAGSDATTGDPATGDAAASTPPGRSDATVIAPADAPPPPDPQDRRPT